MTRFWSRRPDGKRRLGVFPGLADERVAGDKNLVDAFRNLDEALLDPRDALLDEARLFTEPLLADSRGVLNLLRTSTGLSLDHVGSRASVRKDLLDLHVRLELSLA